MYIAKKKKLAKHKEIKLILPSKYQCEGFFFFKPQQKHIKVNLAIFNKLLFLGGEFLFAFTRFTFTQHLPWNRDCARHLGYTGEQEGQYKIQGKKHINRPSSITQNLCQNTLRVSSSCNCDTNHCGILRFCVCVCVSVCCFFSETNAQRRAGAVLLSALVQNLC